MGGGGVGGGGGGDWGSASRFGVLEPLDTTSGLHRSGSRVFDIHATGLSSILHQGANCPNRANVWHFSSTNSEGYCAHLIPLAGVGPLVFGDTSAQLVLPVLLS